MNDVSDVASGRDAAAADIASGGQDAAAADVASGGQDAAAADAVSDRKDAAATRQAVLERLLTDSRFVLATHENPDGDALGSLVAMHDLLTGLGKDAEMFISPRDLPLPFEYRFLQPEHVLEAPPADIAQRTVVFLDCGNIDRNSAAVLRDGAHLVNIDHHHDNTCFGTVNQVVPEASCTAEIVWDLMHGLGVTPSGRVAEALYIGLITDTGRFMYETTGPRAHEMAAELIGAGVDVQGIYRRLFEEVPLSKLRLLAKALGGLRSYDSGQLTLASLSAEDFASADAEESDYEGIVDHLRSVRGTKVAALVREVPPLQAAAGDASGGTVGDNAAGGAGSSTVGDNAAGGAGSSTVGGDADGEAVGGNADGDAVGGNADGDAVGGNADGDAVGGNGVGKRKVSLRATGEDVDVSAIARVQGGGGHRRAAGFSTELGLDEIVALLRREIAAQLEVEQGAAAPA